MSVARNQRGFHLFDVAALVVGYSLASMLIRAYWPPTESLTIAEAAVIGLVFLWLGLAMSGPAVLLVRRSSIPEPGDGRSPDPRTWAELAWMIIGFYWVGLTILVVPARLNGTRFLDSALLGLFPMLAAIALWTAAPRRTPPNPGQSFWTHRAGIVLLVTWPLAWLGLILLGKTYL